MSLARIVLRGCRSIVKGLGVTWHYLFRKKVTLMYPEERPVLEERFRGIPALPIDPVTGRDKCIACGACQRVCPVQVITVTAEVDENKKRRAGDFRLNAARCIFCGLCAEVCPVGAIRMSHEFELADDNRADLVLGLERLHEIGGFLPEKPAPAPKPTEPAKAAEKPEEKPEASPSPSPAPASASAPAAEAASQTPEAAGEKGDAQQC